MTSTLAYQWLFVRLSLRFSLPFAAAAVGWLGVVFPWLLVRVVPAVQGWRPPVFTGVWEAAHGPVLAGALVTLLLALAGLLLALWAAAAVYRILPPRVVLWHRPSAAPLTPPRPPAAGALGRYQRIGIVLAGGGAKGAYQAGALSAIHRFLAERGALGSVRTIAGTSIGAWNACFWLADRIGEEDGMCERWWSRVRLSEVVAPTFWLPTRRNYVLSADPWRRAFRALFAEDPAARDRLLRQLADADAPGNARFYFTRTNVVRAHLEFSTNRREMVDVENASGRRRPLVPGDRWTRARNLGELEEAVFASMDLPPLFEHIRIGDELFEDGGVVENLPIYFGTGIEKCDLLFVLPLNASFTARSRSRGVLKRIERVMAIRQGALERKALKDVYLYNELAVLRDRLEGTPAALPKAAPLDAPAGSPDALREAAAKSLAERAARRVHRPVQIFAVCPDEPLLLDTLEFWKTDAAGRAFRTMREYTLYELEKFDFTAPPNWIRVALVGPEGEVRYLEDF
ncbi:MAG TPA: patatin-like phospholipase family protein [Gemmatimonadota bacterium]|nr:patatin-like phospholipase family protein [Gemmatimonadota bacterium]